jgi:hypothetical protein
MSHLLPSTAKTSPSQTCFIFFNPNGASTNATAMNGRSSGLRCEFVLRVQPCIVLSFHVFLRLQARIALLEGERRSFENIKVDLMRRIKMLEYALRVERSVPILLSTVSRNVTHFYANSSKQLSQSAPPSQSVPPAKLASLQSTSQKDETSSHKEGSIPSSPRSEGIQVLFVSLTLN